MKHTLIVGRRPGNIGDGVALRLLNRTIHNPAQVQMDLTNPSQIRNYVRMYGPWEEIVYCAGLNQLSWIEDLSSEILQEAYAVNVFGLVQLVAAQKRTFRKAPERIVAVVSDSSRTAMRGSLAYSSSKAALVGVLKNMARELAPATVVVGVSPGIVADTPMTAYIDEEVPKFRGWTPDEAKAYEASMIPQKRRVTKDEVVDTIMFALQGPESLSGSIIEITGGK